MKELPKIYIIGNKQEYKSITIKNRINFIEKKLIKKGFNVSNPLEVYKKNKKISNTAATLSNIKKLIECKAVYVMPEVSLIKGENLELKISLDLNLTIITGFYLNTDYLAPIHTIIDELD
jgi:hypothetical protein